MEELKRRLDELEGEIEQMEISVSEAEAEALKNIEPLEWELEDLRVEKRKYASKNDFESVQSIIKREDNIKFKISAQWNRSLILKSDLVKLKKSREDLKYQIKLAEDRARRDRDVKSQMDRVIENYRKTGSLEKAAADSKISYDHVMQWYEWGRNDFNETSRYFYDKISDIDDYFRDLEAQKLKSDMDRVADAFKKTGSLKEASETAGVSYDTVKYWYEWGSRGFGEENTYFYRKVSQ